MIKTVLLVTLCMNFLFGESLLYKEFNLNQTMEQTNLTDFKKVNGIKYNLDKGFVYERDYIYNEKKMTQALRFSDDKKLKIVFFYEKTNSLNIDELVAVPSIIKDVRLMRAHYSLKNQSKVIDEKVYETKDVKNLKNDLSELMLDFYGIIGQTLLTTTSFIQKNDELFNKDTADNFTGVTKLKSCVVIEQEEECAKCEYLEGKHTEVTCSNLTIYHPVVI